jgi:protein-disulfide isomerase
MGHVVAHSAFITEFEVGLSGGFTPQNIYANFSAHGGKIMDDSITLTPPVSARDHIEGREDAPVILVEYADYQCPYCGAAHPVIKRLQKSLGKKLRFVFRNFPLTQSHPYALLAAQASEAAALQGKFWEMHDVIFENQEQLEPEALPAWARQIGLDVSQFVKAVGEGRLTKRIEEDYASGIASGVNGTPSFFINGIKYEGEDDFDSLRAVLLGAEARASEHLH